MLKSVRYFFEGILINVCYFIFGLIPIKQASGFGGFMGRCFGPLFSRTKVARFNLQQAFPDKTEAEIDVIISAMWDNIGRVFCEFPHMGKMQRPGFDHMVKVEGTEYIKSALNGQTGSLFFSGHFANWELAPKTLAMYECPLALVYRKGNNPMLDGMIQKTRNQYQSEAVPKGAEGLRQLIKALREKRHVGMLVDQKVNTGEPVPFFGRDAMTATAIANLALKFNCPIIPTKVVRTGGIYHEVTILPPLEYKVTGDEGVDIRTILVRINEIMEEWGREKPSQWLWIHNRWPKNNSKN